MGVIHRLPDDLANQIAAGEVVERPASVVKELVENAIDARASRIRIDLEGGGLVLLRVSDDGVGMSPIDAELSLERHATSKIAVLGDLAHINSYGFRGEALPSIASVSRFALRTRERAQESGIELLSLGGKLAEGRPCGMAPGTTVEVRDLFFNVPARRKFLRSLATESAHVTDAAEAAALACPELSLVLARDGRVVREWQRATSREERVMRTFSEESLAPCRGERGPVRVEAFLSRPERARAVASALSLFVNGRPIRDRALLRSVCQAYGSVLEPGRYPVGVVYLELAPELMDVNVHPQKSEVRFADGRAVAEALFRVLADELARAFAMPVATRSWNRPGAASSRVAEALQPIRPAAPQPTETAVPLPWSFTGPVNRTDAGSGGWSNPAPIEGAESTPLSYPATARDQQPAFSSLTFIAQVKLTYLLCEGPDGLYIVDQHAAAERLTFHRLRTAYKARDIATQSLLFPVAVAVHERDAVFVSEEQETLTRLGLQVRAIGPGTIAVHALPQLLAHANPETLLRDLIGEASLTGSRAFSDGVDLALATMACHGSIRAGERVQAEAAQALLAGLDQVDFSGHCPHGRPVVTRVGWDELERKVGRR